MSFIKKSNNEPYNETNKLELSSKTITAFENTLSHIL